MRVFVSRLLLFALILALLGACTLSGQSTFATITGAVTDPNGALVPGVKVEITHQGTNYRYSAVSNDVGQYTLANIREGVYDLRAAISGFQEVVVTEIRVAGRDLRRVDLELKVGQVQTAVEVKGGATLIETETARIADIKDRTVMSALPLTLRRSWDFFQLSPTVSKPSGGWYIRFGGSRNKQGDVSFDGTSISNIWGGPINGVLTDRTEGYQEMRVDTAGNSAEFAGVGQMSVVTRSGANEIHGSAFNYYAAPGLLARNPFSPTSTSSVEHVPGGSIGGPVWIPRIYNGKNRTFFFATIEFERFGSPGVSLFNPTVAPAPWRKGDFSTLLPGTVVKDPFGGNTPFPGNIIPQTRLNPVATKVQDRFFPQPNFGDPNLLTSQNFRQTVLAEKEINPTLTLRGDHRFSDKSFMYARLTRVDWINNSWVGAFPTIGRQKGNRFSRAASVAFTHTIRPTLLSETRWGYSSDNSPAAGPVNGLQLVKDLGLQGLAPSLPDLTGLYNVSFSGIGLTGLSGGAECNPCNFSPRHVFQQNVSWFRNRHSIKMGFGFGRAGYSTCSTPGSLFGNNTFSNRFTNHPYGDFLIGIPTTAARNYPPLRQDLVSWSYSGFITDEFRLNRTLTLTLGLRYEVAPGFTEAHGLLSMFDAGAGKVVVPDGSLNLASPLMPKGYVDVVEASSLGLPASLVRTDKNNLAPRFAVAWRPLGNDTVFRGGFGIYYDIVARNPSSASVPFNLAEPSFTNPADRPAVILPAVFPSTGTGGPSTVSIPGAINPGLRIPYSMQYSATIEHQRWDTGFRLSYIGTNTRQGVWSYDYNQPAADSRPYIDKPRAFPRYPSVSYFTNGAGHQYNSLTAEMKRTTSSGLHYQLYYTLARDIGDLEDGQSPENAYDRKRERAVWPDIPTHRLSGNVIYDLPFGKGKKFAAGAGRGMNALAGGWSLSVIGAAENGFFLTPSWTGPDPTGTRYTTSRTAPSVTLRPNHRRDANLSHPAPSRWFDVDAFAAPAAGSFGTSAKGVIKGPGTQVLHAALAKQFSIRERAKLRLELNASNVLNHPNYVDPNTNITSTATVGTINNVVNRNSKMDMAIPRYIQLIARLQW
ncbi:MAG: carboxypeptidase regulatory-like domain-containing protein [Acidobacteria bacterium]|nr:carboxypeptidase regulatory-like domain-containing protein [Acidobacteriota bacterium]